MNLKSKLILLTLTVLVGNMHASWWGSNNSQKPTNNFEFYNKSGNDVTFLLVDISEAKEPVKPLEATLGKQTATPWVQTYIPMNRDYKIYIWNRQVTPKTNYTRSVLKFWTNSPQITPTPDYIYDLSPKSINQTAYLTWRGNALEPQTGRLGGGIGGYTFTQSGLFFDKNINFIKDQIKRVK